MREKIPVHIAIIPDGNGRWATQKGLPRFEGHRKGMERIKEIIRVSKKRGIKYLTLYVFSTENWKRPKKEIHFLFRSLEKYLYSNIDELMKEQVCLRVIGEKKNVPKYLQKAIHIAVERTKLCGSLTVVLAFNYGAADEIAHAISQIAALKKKNKPNVRITYALLEKYLYTAGMPNPDLLIRTSGEKRISNFLLLQLSYSELYFTDVLWPDFDDVEYEKAIEDYSKRKRRFGGL